jgi:hypothetical protein
MGAHVNGYTGGLNSDTAETLYSNSTYTNSVDFRIVTDEGLSSGVLVNIQGNQNLINIPDVNSVWEIDILDSADNQIPGSSHNFQIVVEDVNNPGVEIFNESVSIFFNGREDLAAQMEAQLEDWNTTFGIEFIYSRDNDRFVIYSAIGNITEFHGGVPSVYVNYTQLTQPVSNLVPIGSATIRDTIVIFTCPEANTGEGQIWALTYDRESLVANIELIYTNDLGFSTDNLIEAVGRYEYSLGQKVYWTDNFNPPRSINIADPNALSTPLELIDLNNVVSLEPVIVSAFSESTISTKIMKPGTYQFSYRFKDTETGGTSNYARLSAPFRMYKDFIIGSDGYGNWHQNPSDILGNQLELLIRGIEDGYDSVEVVVAYTSNDEPLPLYFKFDEILLTGEEDLTFIFDKDVSNPDSEMVALDPSFITVFNTEFEKVKTLTIKDNRLLVANVKEAGFNLEFDARAYRYQSNSSSTYPQDENAINPYNKLSTRNTESSLQYKFKENSTILGGTGANISYEFQTREIILDDQPTNGPSTASVLNPTFPVKRVDTNVPSTITINGIDYPTAITDNTTTYPQPYNYRSPFVEQLLKGYHRTEVYRFGIVFFSKAGRPTEVKWIGDIKMPDNYDVDANGSYIYSNVSGGQLKGNVLGLTFTVDLPIEIQEQISGFSIVRSPRTTDDMTIYGSGLINEFRDDGSNDRLVNRTNPLTSLNIKTEAFSLDSPTFKFNGNILQSTPESNNGVAEYLNDNEFNDLKITPIVGYSSTFSQGNYDGTSLDYIKIYDAISILDDSAAGDNYQNSTYSLTEYESQKAAGGFTVLAGNSWWNELETTQEDSTNTFIGVGQPQLVNELYSKLGLSTFVDIDKISGTDRVYAYINREVNNQYGGNTTAGRQQSTYIFTGHYQSVDSKDGVLSYTAEVFGGDTYITNFTEVKSQDKVAHLFPVETVVNSEIRQSEHAFPSSGLAHTFYNWDSAGTLANLGDLEKYDLPTSFYATNTADKPVNIEGLAIVSEYDNRIYASEVKINGETTESWGIFKSNNFLDVDGHHGPINKLNTLREDVYTLQDRGFAKIAVNPRAVISTTEGSQLELGTGDVLYDHAYISREVGCRHREGSVIGRNILYFYDANTAKMYQFAESLKPISDNTISAFLYNNTKNFINKQNTYNEGGVAFTYDNRYNEALFTFKHNEQFKDDFTLVFSERLNNFAGFYSFTPNLYFNDHINILSPDPNNPYQLYIHDKGQYGVFYNQAPSTCILETIVNPQGSHTKVFNNVEYLTQVSQNGIDIPLETLSSVRLSNEYQDTGQVGLVPHTPTNTLNYNVRRRMRTWRFNNPRGLQNERIRNPYTTLEVRFINNDNKRLELHNLISHYMDIPM